MTLRARTDFIVIHCTATPVTMDIGAREVRRMHKQRGWSDIGYHRVIRRDGTAEAGRPLSHVGAGVGGHNHNTVHVALVGGVKLDARTPEDNFTPPQWAALYREVQDLIAVYPGAKVLGHRDFPNVAKACPCFDARAWAERLLLPTHYFPGQKRGVRVAEADFPPTFDNDTDTA